MINTRETWLPMTASQQISCGPLGHGFLECKMWMWSEVKWKLLSRIWLFAIPWNSPGQNTGVSSLSLLQGIFPTQESNQALLYCRWILYQLSYQGSPRILEWVAYPFCGGSSRPRNWSGISCIAGGFFTNWAIREAKMGIRVSIFSGGKISWSRKEKKMKDRWISSWGNISWEIPSVVVSVSFRSWGTSIQKA